ncbi:hypothetical protein B296_00035495 [Ensete ventricosum]|uniref:Uncharacterized protein n=1 Tax=Ensete ventricosum TaxID=4639 RepID=A0A426Y3K7_ENSVE|nr:hypothetical protein B296_00035495 [Ensete ventricosum]
MSLRRRCGRTWSQRDCRSRQAMGGEKDGCGCWNLARWQQQEEAVAARRCNGRVVVESGCSNEDTNGKGGGSGVVRSAGSGVCEKRRGGTEVADSSGRKGSVGVLGRLPRKELADGEVRQRRAWPRRQVVGKRHRRKQRVVVVRTRLEVRGEGSDRGRRGLRLLLRLWLQFFWRRKRGQRLPRRVVEAESRRQAQQGSGGATWCGQREKEGRWQGWPAAVAGRRGIEVADGGRGHREGEGSGDVRLLR